MNPIDSSKFTSDDNVYKIIKNLDKQLKHDPKLVSNRLKEILVSIQLLPQPSIIFSQGCIKWIEKKIIPQGKEAKTLTDYQAWMIQLAANRVPLDGLVQDELAKINMTQLFTATSLSTIQQIFVKKFGETAYVAPLVEYLMRHYTAAQTSTLLPFLAKLPAEQMTEEVLKLILLEQSGHSLHGAIFRNSAFEMTSFALQAEITHHSDVCNSLLRDDSAFAIKLFKCFSRYKGSFWVTSLFSETFNHLAQNDETTNEIHSSRVLKKLKASIPAARNSPSLCRTDTGSSIKSMPYEIYDLLRMIREKSHQCFPNQKDLFKNIDVVFLALYVLSPCLIFPKKFAMHINHPESNQPKRIAIAKLIQDEMSKWDSLERIAENPVPASDKVVRKSVSLEDTQALTSSDSQEKGSMSVNEYPLRRQKSKTLIQLHQPSNEV